MKRIKQVCLLIKVERNSDFVLLMTLISISRALINNESDLDLTLFGSLNPCKLTIGNWLAIFVVEKRSLSQISECQTVIGFDALSL
jgi:hypothetical protein